MKTVLVMSHSNHVPLKNEIEKVYGKKVVAYSDCLAISKEITLRTGFRLNVNTLRRFFGLVQASYPPSITTLDILAKFCGFKSYEHVTTFSSSGLPADDATTSPLLHYLDILFHKAALTTYADPTWISIVRETILLLEKFPHLLDSFQRSAAETIIGQEVYFEQFVNIDQLDSYYGNGLRYYINEKNTTEAQIFAHSLLALRYFLTNDFDALERHYQEVMHHSIDERIHPFVCARYYSAQFFYYQEHPTKIYKVVSAARSFFRTMVPARDVYQSFPCFELIMIDSLILTRQPLEALFYLQEARKKRTDYIPPAVDVHLFSPFDLYESVAYAMLGEEERAKKAFRKINPAEFYFLSKHYHNTIYMILEAILFPAKAKTNHPQVADLIQRTGFQKLDELFVQKELVNKKEQIKSIQL